MSVFAVISAPSEVSAMTRLALRLACAYDGVLTFGVVDPGSTLEEPRSFQPGDGLDSSTSSELLKATSTEVRAALQTCQIQPHSADDSPPSPTSPAVEIVDLPGDDPLQRVLAALGEKGSDLLLVGKQAPRKPNGGPRLARELFDTAPCRTLLVRFAEDPTATVPADTAFGRVVVATAGGHHARAALRIGSKLAEAEQGQLRAVWVQSPAVELASEVGQRALATSLTDAGLLDSPHVRRQVELAEEVDEGIRQALDADTDLLLLGASRVGELRRQLFGSVPERLFAENSGLIVGVVRERWRLFHRLRTRLGRWLDLTIPQMTREERVTLYETLQSGSLWRFDFLALIALSTAIATLGLLQSSTAVVIGAMLVAPLMTPILGAGLGLVQGNLPLLRAAAKAIVYGYLTALVIAFALGFAVPLPELTAELLARGGPTLLDLGVAWFSGLAAAYCLSRPGLTAALPGVAIAAALVPPIATTGVSIAHGEVANARGAALLFGTNVVAIVLGAGLAFYAGGVRGKRGAANQTWVRAGFLALLVTVAVLAVPLGSELLSSLRAGTPQMTLEGPSNQQLVALEKELAQAVGRRGAGRLVDVDLRRRNQLPVLVVEIESPRPTSAALVAELGRLGRRALGNETTVRVRQHLVSESPPKDREIP